jgi:hypothetical protein
MIKNKDCAITHMEKEEIHRIITEELEKIQNHKTHLGQGCAACHVMFTLKNTLGSSEQDCADMVSQILSEDSKLNENFIETVEQIHMSERGLGGSFAMRERESKDAYLDVYFGNVLDELKSDMTQYSSEILLRKLLLAYLSLYIAQTIGVDYHAATEELYYILRKNEKNNLQLDEFIDNLQDRIKRT